MRWRGLLYVLYVLLVLVAGVYGLVYHFPEFDIDVWQQLAVMVVLVVLAEWLAVWFPQGTVSGGFAVILAAFLIYGGEEAVYVAGFSTLIAQGIANRGQPLRTTLFNAAQYILAAWGAVALYQYAGGVIGSELIKNLLPLLAFVAAYYIINHTFTYLYHLPRRDVYPILSWSDVLKWDAITYLFTTPIGLLMFLLYSSNGVVGAALFFVPVIILQYVLRLYVNLKLLSRELTVFYNISSRLAVTDLDKLIELIFKEFRRIASYHTGIFYLWWPDKKYFEPVVIKGTFARQLRGFNIYPGDGFVSRVAKEREPLLVEDTRKDKVLRQEPGLPQVMRSLLAVPLVSYSGVVGVIVFGCRRSKSFDHRHLHILTIIGHQVAMAVQNALLSNRLRLFFDPKK